MKKRLFFLMLLCLSIGSAVFSQGVTTASLSGTVSDEKGEAVMMANVLAVHTPSGTQYATTTMEDGRFQMRNMRIGGPYKVTVTYVGFENTSATDIFLQLNNTSFVKLIMKSTSQQLGEIEVKADREIIREQTGAMTNLESKQITSLPGITRSQQDLTRLTPQSDGNSFGGRNVLYNNFSLDGSIFNNSFGLDYATPGGQSDAQPVSLDAIDQIQVSLAPFDVREGGFTGAGVNVVTKSGTNDFKATAYHYFRNEGMIGKKISGEDAPNLDFSTSQTGLSVGGPIIKNKLFFFVNAEMERANQLAHGFVANNGTNDGQPNVTSVSEADIKAVHDHLLNEWGYEAGAYQGYNHEKSNNKFLVKLNYNISNNHKLVLRYNMLDASKDILPHPEAIIGRGPTSYRLPFENSSYTIFNKIHSFVGELNSNFSNKISNKLLVGYTVFDDSREPKSAQFPVIDIFDQNVLAISAGSEMFSTHNTLKQNVLQFTDNVTYYAERHTITGGVNFEKFYFENSFNLFYYPWHTFGGVDGFLSQTKDSIDFNAEVATANAKPYSLSIVDVAQLGIYGQDEFQLNENFKLTFGLRVDIPIYLNKLAVTTASEEAANFDGWVDKDGNTAKLDPAVWPKSRLMWSPRLGFNYDVHGDNTLRFRGGTGIFTGRIPFVWLGNQASNPGINPGYTFQVNSTTENFKFPQVWKTDIAVDWAFSEGWVSTFEAIYGKDINAIVHRNYNMKAPSQKLSGADDREIFAGFNETNIYSASEGSVGFLEAGYIVMDNVKEGHQLSLTGKIAKEWGFGLKGDLAYTYQQSKDYTSIPAEIAADAFQRNPVVGNPNTPSVSWSRYGLKHRFISSWMYAKEYKSMVSTFGMFIELGQGNRYSYTYAGDLNRDAIVNNDLLYVPSAKADINFGSVDSEGNGSLAADADEQWAALSAFIDQDPYLKNRKGDYAERNGASLPWFSQIDFRFMQDFNFKVKERKHTIQVSLDIMNLGNLINSNWGVRQLARTYNPISVTGIDKDNVPYYHFNSDLKTSYVDDFSTRSKWQMQLGIRYIL
ncbi:MAG: TonB-dependent receptor [Bacteroidales bacterium]|nr:TonB-dependent receptor [Bacteroidales bacterium]